MSSSGERARGALYGLAIGDALGMPTQLMSREDVTVCFGVLDGFREPPADHKIAAGLTQNVEIKVASQAWRMSDIVETLEQQLLAG